MPGRRRNRRRVKKSELGRSGKHGEETSGPERRAWVSG